MRKLLLLALILPAAARAESAMCEYRHPAHPGWDFFAACTVVTERADGAETTRAEVSNGSRFTLTRGNDGVSFAVNGLAASPEDAGAARCLRTLAENELVCIHPADAAIPSAPLAAAPLPDAGTAPAGSFGGGIEGYCLLAAPGPQGETLVEYGACVRRENCLVAEASGATTCLTDIDWASGRLTELARTPEWHTLDGAAVTRAEGDCLASDAARFCFSREKLPDGADPLAAPPAAAAPAAQ